MSPSKATLSRFSAVASLGLALSGVSVPAPSWADDTSFMSPVVSYQFADSLGDNGSTLLSPIVTYQFAESLGANGSTLLSSIVSFQYLQSPGLLSDVTIQGPNVIQSGQSGSYSAFAHFADGSSRDVSSAASWKVVSPVPTGTGFYDEGTLLTSPAVDHDYQLQIRASYSENGETVSSAPFGVIIRPVFQVRGIRVVRTFDPVVRKWALTFIASPQPAGPDGGAVQYEWNFGNMFPISTERSPTVHFAPGGYPITLTVYDAANTAAAQTEWITVDNPPVVQQPNVLPARDVVAGTVLDKAGAHFRFDPARRANGFIAITHGMRSSGDAPWVIQMANEIEKRFPTASRPNICIYDWRQYARPSGLNNSYDENSIFAGVNSFLQDVQAIRPYAVAQGVKFAEWMQQQIANSTLDPTKPIHLIGHSAGGFLFGECAVLLRQHVSQVTMLDTPFPLSSPFKFYPDPGKIERYISSEFGGAFPAVLLHTVREYYEVQCAPGLETTMRTTQPSVGNPQFNRGISPNNYYFREVVCMPRPCLLIPARGGNITYTEELVYHANTLHETSHEWYLSTIVDTSIRDGFYYSPLLPNGFHGQAPLDAKLLNRLQRFDGQDLALTISNFEMFGAVAHSNGTYWFTETLDAGIHTRLEIPQEAQSLEFTYQFVNGGDGDFLTVHWGTNELLYVGSDSDLSRTNEVPVEIPLRLYARQTNQLILRLVSRGLTNAVLKLDSIRFTLSDDTDGDGLKNTEEATLGTDPDDPDSDHDGLSDTEEAFTYHSNPLSNDSDGDAMTDGDELLAGSDLNNSSSLVKIKEVHFDGFRSLTIQWQAITNRFYRVHRSVNPSRENYSTLTNDLPGSNALMRFTDIFATNHTYFYWVEVQ